ncbi:uncharacterized protein J4E84_005916 [Alternaria hordeiaustralica]|uniref:uncharacterized protein n=1 Tax=Alternaria hordeiaustralica TaxID=1187925 RepID=UPI0020C37115|nr:uncharacterized protein J4E84_005916 [Alternaria hordeiaustralica]KAI4686635.1 hypothetical protein J4E84_005916 [Alternaria hordeiaustralica]
MSATTPSLRANTAHETSRSSDDGFEIVEHDHDVLSIPGSQDGTPVPTLAVTEETERNGGMDESRESRPWLWDYDEFHDAIKGGDLDGVKKMLDDGANVERGTDEGESPLILAILKQDIAIIMLLLERGADVTRPFDGFPPTHHAVMQKDRAPQIIQLLLDHGASLEAVGTENINALHFAASNGMIHGADFLIGKGVELSKTCEDERTPLILAAKHGHLAIVRLLLAKGADLHEKSENSCTVLMWAAEYGHHEVVLYLLEAGARVDDRSVEDLTALSLASMNGRLEVVQLLIESGADINALSLDPASFTPAMFAALQGHAEVLQVLLSHGADYKPDFEVDWADGDKILDMTMTKGHLAAAKILLEAIGGPDYPKDSIALQMATAQSRVELVPVMKAIPLMYKHIDSNPTADENLGWVEWVLDQGGALVRSRAMCNMLFAAIVEKDVGVTAELLRLGANPNVIGFMGYTPLHIAVGKQICSLAIVELLLEAGADPAKVPQNTTTPTPLHFAILGFETSRPEKMAIFHILLASGRCKIMKGPDAQSSAFLSVVSALDGGSADIAKSLASWMLDFISDVNDDKADDGSTPMHVAVKYNQKVLIDALRREGADINAQSNDGMSPLLLACEMDVELINFLVTRCADVSAVNKKGQGALQIAAACGQVKVLRFLLDLDLAEEEPLNIDAVDDAGLTPLIAAIAEGHEAAALFLLVRGASVQQRTTEKGRLALHYAAQASMNRIVEFMLGKSCNDIINVEDHGGYTPLALACMADTPTVVPALLSYGADPNVICQNTGDRPLHIALKRPLHMDRGADRESSPPLDLLKHADTDITARDGSGRKPLHLASEFHNLEATRLLLSKGVSPHSEDNKARTPLCLCSNPYIAQALIDHGAHVNHTDENGWTPLHYAVSRCWVKAFAVLRQAGADMDMRTRDDGLSVKERLDTFGSWQNWVDTEREMVCDDAQREKIREFDVRTEMAMKVDRC